MTDNNTSVQLMNNAAIDAALQSIAEAILRRHEDTSRLAVVGIQRRGVFLASRLKSILDKKLGCSIPEGMLDINLYRDDWTTLGPRAVVGRTLLNFDIAGKDLVLVDDVLFTGRTIRAALEGLASFGRPRKVELAVLIDRGHRELPIHADYTGQSVTTRRDDRVDVMLTELDGRDEVLHRSTK